MEVIKEIFKCLKSGIEAIIGFFKGKEIEQ